MTSGASRAVSQAVSHAVSQAGALGLLETPISRGFWAELRAAGLVAKTAPLPE